MLLIPGYIRALFPSFHLSLFSEKNIISDRSLVQFYKEIWRLHTMPPLNQETPILITVHVYDLISDFSLNRDFGSMGVDRLSVRCQTLWMSKEIILLGLCAEKCNHVSALDTSGELWSRLICLSRSNRSEANARRLITELLDDSLTQSSMKHRQNPDFLFTRIHGFPIDLVHFPPCCYRDLSFSLD